MKRRAFLAACALAGCRRHGPRLNVFNWSDYVAPDTVSNFEKETGIRVRYATFESNEEMLAKVLSGNSGWDVVFPTCNRVAPMRDNGLLAPIRPEWLPNLAHMHPRFREVEPGWCVPYMWMTTGIAYNRSITPPPASWADLWNPRFKGRMTMLDDPEDNLGACLSKLGYGYFDTDPAHLRRARVEAIAVKPLLRAYLNADVRDQLVAGDVLMAQAWSTTARQAMAAAPHLNFVHAREGFPLYVDCAAVLRESRRAELAHRFIDYLLRPAVAATIMQATGTSHVILPPQPGGQWPIPLPAAAQSLRDRLWTEIKSA